MVQGDFIKKDLKENCPERDGKEEGVSCEDGRGWFEGGWRCDQGRIKGLLWRVVSPNRYTVMALIPRSSEMGILARHDNDKIGSLSTGRKEDGEKLEKTRVGLRKGQQGRGGLP